MARKKRAKKMRLRKCSPRQSKYFVLQGHYGSRYGWEDLTAEDTRSEILQRLKEYRENEGGRYRIVKKRCLK